MCEGCFNLFVDDGGLEASEESLCVYDDDQRIIVVCEVEPPENGALSV
jgi:hypothetical protein